MGLGDTTGVLPVANGGTGLSASPSMLTNLGSTAAANVLQASPRPGVTGTLPITNGGTGKTTAADAWAALGGGASGKHADSYFALAGHTHTTSLASGGTATVNLAANTAYTLTAGGTSVIFKTPAETDPVFTASPAHGITSSNITAWNGKMNTPSGGTAGQVLTKTANGYG